MRYSWDMGQELWLLGGTYIGTLQGGRGDLASGSLS